MVLLDLLLFLFKNLKFFFNLKNANTDNSFMHLTNYSINKKNSGFLQNFIKNGKEYGHKRSLSSVFKNL